MGNRTSSHNTTDTITTSNEENIQEPLLGTEEKVAALEGQSQNEEILPEQSEENVPEPSPGTEQSEAAFPQSRKRERYSWEESFQAVAEFYRANGHLTLGKATSEYRRLEAWLHVQRQMSNKLSDTKLAKLKSINFDVASNYPTKNDRKWREKLSELEKCLKNGTNRGQVLGNWLSKQRRLHLQGKLDDCRRDELMRLGLLEPVKTETSKQKALWMKQFQKLRDFHAANGHLNVTMSMDKPLACWVYTQRTCYKLHQQGHPTMPGYRIQALENLGFEWSSCKSNRNTSPESSVGVGVWLGFQEWLAVRKANALREEKSARIETAVTSLQAIARGKLVQAEVKQYLAQKKLRLDDMPPAKRLKEHDDESVLVEEVATEVVQITPPPAAAQLKISTNSGVEFKPPAKRLEEPEEPDDESFPEEAATEAVQITPPQTAAQLKISTIGGAEFKPPAKRWEEPDDESFVEEAIPEALQIATPPTAAQLVKGNTIGGAEFKPPFKGLQEPEEPDDESFVEEVVADAVDIIPAPSAVRLVKGNTISGAAVKPPGRRLNKPEESDDESALVEGVVNEAAEIAPPLTVAQLKISTISGTAVNPPVKRLEEPAEPDDESFVEEVVAEAVEITPPPTAARFLKGNTISGTAVKPPAKRLKEIEESDDESVLVEEVFKEAAETAPPPTVSQLKRSTISAGIEFKPPAKRLKLKDGKKSEQKVTAQKQKEPDSGAGILSSKRTLRSGLMPRIDQIKSDNKLSAKRLKQGKKKSEKKAATKKLKEPKTLARLGGNSRFASMPVAARRKAPTNRNSNVRSSYASKTKKGQLRLLKDQIDCVEVLKKDKVNLNTKLSLSEDENHTLRIKIQHLEFENRKLIDENIFLSRCNNNLRKSHIMAMMEERAHIQRETNRRKLAEDQLEKARKLIPMELDDAIFL